jgi:hypothetical protein
MYGRIISAVLFIFMLYCIGNFLGSVFVFVVSCNQAWPAAATDMAQSKQ